MEKEDLLAYKKENLEEKINEGLDAEKDKENDDSESEDSFISKMTNEMSKSSSIEEKLNEMMKEYESNTSQSNKVNRFQDLGSFDIILAMIHNLYSDKTEFDEVSYKAECSQRIYELIKKERNKNLIAALLIAADNEITLDVKKVHDSLLCFKGKKWEAWDADFVKMTRKIVAEIVLARYVRARTPKDIAECAGVIDTRSAVGDIYLSIITNFQRIQYLIGPAKVIIDAITKRSFFIPIGKAFEKLLSSKQLTSDGVIIFLKSEKELEQEIKYIWKEHLQGNYLLINHRDIWWIYLINEKATPEKPIKIDLVKINNKSDLHPLKEELAKIKISDDWQIATPELITKLKTLGFGYTAIKKLWGEHADPKEIEKFTSNFKYQMYESDPVVKEFCNQMINFCRSYRKKAMDKSMDPKYASLLSRILGESARLQYEAELGKYYNKLFVEFNSSKIYVALIKNPKNPNKIKRQVMRLFKNYNPEKNTDSVRVALFNIDKEFREKLEKIYQTENPKSKIKSILTVDIARDNDGNCFYIADIAIGKKDVKRVVAKILPTLDDIILKTVTDNEQQTIIDNYNNHEFLLDNEEKLLEKLSNKQELELTKETAFFYEDNLYYILKSKFHDNSEITLVAKLVSKNKDCWLEIIPLEQQKDLFSKYNIGKDLKKIEGNFFELLRVAYNDLYLKKILKIYPDIQAVRTKNTKVDDKGNFYRTFYVDLKENNQIVTVEITALIKATGELSLLDEKNLDVILKLTTVWSMQNVFPKENLIPSSEHILFEINYPNEVIGGMNFELATTMKETAIDPHTIIHAQDLKKQSAKTSKGLLSYFSRKATGLSEEACNKIAENAGFLELASLADPYKSITSLLPETYYDKKPSPTDPEEQFLFVNINKSVTEARGLNDLVKKLCQLNLIMGKKEYQKYQRAFIQSILVFGKRQDGKPIFQIQPIPLKELIVYAKWHFHIMMALRPPIMVDIVLYHQIIFADMIQMGYPVDEVFNNLKSILNFIKDKSINNFNSKILSALEAKKNIFLKDIVLSYMAILFDNESDLIIGSVYSSPIIDNIVTTLSEKHPDFFDTEKKLYLKKGLDLKVLINSLREIIFNKILNILVIPLPKEYYYDQDHNSINLIKLTFLKGNSYAIDSIIKFSDLLTIKKVFTGNIFSDFIPFFREVIANRLLAKQPVHNLMKLIIKFLDTFKNESVKDSFSLIFKFPIQQSNVDQNLLQLLTVNRNKDFIIMLIENKSLLGTTKKLINSEAGYLLINDNKDDADFTNFRNWWIDKIGKPEIPTQKNINNNSEKKEPSSNTPSDTVTKTSSDSGSDKYSSSKDFKLTNFFRRTPSGNQLILESSIQKPFKEDKKEEEGPSGP